MNCCNKSGRQVQYSTHGPITIKLRRVNSIRMSILLLLLIFQLDYSIINAFDSADPYKVNYLKKTGKINDNEEEVQAAA